MNLGVVNAIITGDNRFSAPIQWSSDCVMLNSLFYLSCIVLFKTVLLWPTWVFVCLIMVWKSKHSLDLLQSCVLLPGSDLNSQRSGRINTSECVTWVNTLLTGPQRTALLKRVPQYTGFIINSEEATQEAGFVDRA